MWVRRLWTPRKIDIQTLGNWISGALIPTATWSRMKIASNELAMLYSWKPTDPPLWHLKQGFGRLWPSHECFPRILEHDYEVTGLELIPWCIQPGNKKVSWALVWQDRLYGCAIVVNKDKVEAFKEGRQPLWRKSLAMRRFYIAEVAAGTRVLD